MDAHNRSDPDFVSYPEKHDLHEHHLDNNGNDPYFDRSNYSNHAINNTNPSSLMPTTTSINNSNGSTTLKRISSKIDLLKKSNSSNSNHSNNSKSSSRSKFATITTAFSSSRTSLPRKTRPGSASSTTVDLASTATGGGASHEGRGSNCGGSIGQSLNDLSCTLGFSVTELKPDKTRDVLSRQSYRIQVEGSDQVLEVTRTISDFIEFDDKVARDFPKARPQLPVFDGPAASTNGDNSNGNDSGNNAIDKRKSFLVSTRQFFFPRKNMAEKLESYLRKVVSHGPLRQSGIFLDFLSVWHQGDMVRSKEKSGGSVGVNANGDKVEVLPRAASGNDVANTQHGHYANGHGNEVSRSATTGRIPKQSTRGSKSRPPIPTQSVQPVVEKKKASIEDFQLLKVLGRGCMGKVFLVREHSTKKLMALKAISKEWVILQREIEHTKSERNILANVANISHPFLIRLRHSFQSKTQLFMVLDYYPGGDIATQLAKWHCFEPERCLFYAAEIVLGIEELHRLGIVYRDLKPENILLARDGHLVLTDFGLSKQFKSFVGEEKTSTFCGTAEYLAPEILLAAEYSYAVDWWSLGTLLFEMLIGITPFWAENHAQMYNRVLEDELTFPADTCPIAANFIAGLLDRNPLRRLGSGPLGASEVKVHPYFRSIDWDQAMQRQLPCPYVPDLESEEDFSNFDETFLTMTPRLSPGAHTLSNSIQDCFIGYSYTNKLATTLPRNDSKLRFNQQGGRTMPLVDANGNSYRSGGMVTGSTATEAAGGTGQRVNGVANGRYAQDPSTDPMTAFDEGFDQEAPPSLTTTARMHQYVDAAAAKAEIGGRGIDGQSDDEENDEEEDDEDGQGEGLDYSDSEDEEFGHLQDPAYRQPQGLGFTSHQYGGGHIQYLPPSQSHAGASVLPLDAQAQPPAVQQQQQQQQQYHSHYASPMAAVVRLDSKARPTTIATSPVSSHAFRFPGASSPTGLGGPLSASSSGSGGGLTTPPKTSLTSSSAAGLLIFENEGVAQGRVMSATSMGGAATATDILRGYNERTSLDTQRHNSTSSSRSSGTIGRGIY